MKKILFILLAVIVIMSAYFFMRWERIEFKDLAQPCKATIAGQQPHYLSIEVVGHTQKGGVLVSHFGKQRTLIPAGKVDKTVQGELYERKDTIEYVPNPNDCGNLIIKYKIRNI